MLFCQLLVFSLMQIFCSFLIGYYGKKLNEDHTVSTVNATSSDNPASKSRGNRKNLMLVSETNVCRPVCLHNREIHKKYRFSS